MAAALRPEDDPLPDPFELLRTATPPTWIDAARVHWQELLLDHANCEKKAASSALSLIFAYADDPSARPAELSRLAREELRHFEQVQRILSQLKVPYRRLKPGRYAEGLRRAVRAREPGRCLDLLICGALIEARSCERFIALAPQLAEPLRTFYASLAELGGTSLRGLPAARQARGGWGESGRTRAQNRRAG